MSQTNQKLSLSVNGQDFDFEITRAAYNKFVNGFSEKNKTQPSHNLLMTTVATDHKDALREFLVSTPSADVQLAGHLMEQYIPDLDIVVKKHSN